MSFAPPAGDESRATRRKKDRHRAVPLLPEVRHFAATGLEVRNSSDSDEIVIVGSPIVYGVPYTVRDMFGEFEERMAAGVADDVLARGADVRFLFNHDGLPLARTLAGTMDIVSAVRALNFEARLDARQQLATDLAIAIERGDITQMSCGFIVARDEWDDSFTQRTIYSLADLLDVSAVTYPASPQTSIQIAQRMALEVPVETRARARKFYAELRAGRVLSQSNQDQLVNAAQAIHAVLDTAGFDPEDLVNNDAATTDDDATTGSSSGADTSTDADASGTRTDSIPETAAERRDASLSFGDQRSLVYQALLVHLGSDVDEDQDGDIDVWLCDLGSDWAVFQNYCDHGPGPGLFKLSYALVDGVVTFGDDMVRVFEKTSYEPVEAEADDAEAPAETRNASRLRLLAEARNRGLI